MLYIIAIFLISYVPVLCCLLMINVLKRKEEKVMNALTICIIFSFSCPVFHPLFYYWRIKEIRDGVRNIVKWLLHTEIIRICTVIDSHCIRNFARAVELYLAVITFPQQIEPIRLALCIGRQNIHIHVISLIHISQYLSSYFLNTFVQKGIFKFTCKGLRELARV